jgi:hypothetical protein
LPRPNSLIGIPKPIARRPASRQAIPATNIPIVIKPTPTPRRTTRAAAPAAPDATIPSYCAPRHGNYRGNSDRWGPPWNPQLTPKRLLRCAAVGEFATIANYLATELRYTGTRGNKARKR